MHMGKDLTEVRGEHKETRAAHVGLEQHEQTSLRGIAKRAVMPDAEASTTEEPDAGKLHVRVCAGGSGNRGSYRKRLVIQTILVSQYINEP